METEFTALKSIDVLIIIDVVNALATGNLTNNTYMVDTNKYMGSSGEGTNKLHTKCYDTQRINWRVASVSPNCEVKIVKFYGNMVSTRVCDPQKQGDIDDEYWSAKVQARLEKGKTATYSYYCEILVGGKRMDFDPYIEVVG